MTVHRDQILAFETYSDQRDQIRASAMKAKELRRVVVGGVLTFLFECDETVRYQVLEMVRTERMVREAEIQHELDTYNELLGVGGSLGATLLIGIPDPEERDRRLKEWLDLPGHLYALLEDGTKVGATWDERQVGDDRLSAVQFLQFEVGGRVPVAMGSDLPALAAETALGDQMRAALAADLDDAAR